LFPVYRRNKNAQNLTRYLQIHSQSPVTYTLIAALNTNIVQSALNKITNWHFLPGKGSGATVSPLSGVGGVVDGVGDALGGDGKRMFP
jgi:hypothetical protein